MSAAPPSAIDRTLALAPADGVFGDDELEGAPTPVRRYLGAAIAPGTPLARAARVAMRGSIRLRGRWLPFRAAQLLAPHHGGVWRARVAGLVSGADWHADGRGGMAWNLLGAIPVVRAEGPDVSRSSAERFRAEAIWVPTALLPRFGVVWSAEDETHVTARFGEERLALQIAIDDRGRVRSVHLDRWGDPDGRGRFAAHPFGADATGSGTFAGLTIPHRGRAGWFHGSGRWTGGEFFRYEIVALRPITS